MRSKWILAAAMMLPAAAAAQKTVPAGTIIPVSLDNDINAQRAHAGDEIRATVMQNLPGTPVHRGDHVLGHITGVSLAKGGPIRIDLRFDAIEVRRQRIPFTMNLRALASPTEVEDADESMYGPDAGIGADVESTNQIGGDLVYHGGGAVFAGSTVIGKSTAHGVLVRVQENIDRRCRGTVAGNNHDQALWRFSSDACGVYGFDIRIAHAGRTNPLGTISLVSESGKLHLYSRTGLLLRVDGA